MIKELKIHYERIEIEEKYAIKKQVKWIKHVKIKTIAAYRHAGLKLGCAP